MLKNTMDLYIETLTGTAFELRVSQFETVMSVKAKIQRQEGIPISQQHLIWQSEELEDDYCLHDYSIGDGATVKLVLAMRGGPINTRRVEMEEPALREMAEYMEANRDEFLDKISGNHQVTLLVYKEGDQLNFFRVVDRGDGTLTPFSESLSGASVYNLYDEGEESDGSRDKGEENDKTKEKMKLLRMKMANLTIAKKPKKMKPRPPLSGRPGSRSRIRHTFSTGKPASSHQPMVHRSVLPPVGQSVVTPGVSRPSDSKSNLSQLTAQEHSYAKPSYLPSVNEQHGETVPTYSKPSKIHNVDTLGPLLPSARHKTESSKPSTTLLFPSSSGPSDSPANPSTTEITLGAFKDLSIRPSTSSRGLDQLLSHTGESESPRKETLQTLVPRPPTSSKYGTGEHKGLVLESLSQQEARGLLTQASLERLGSSNISNFVASGSKNRVPNFALKEQGRIMTPDGRLLSARLKMSNGLEGRSSPSTRLPPVKQKKKSKRCFLCTKKTGLANSYLCRCGNNFCATHRYAEAHNCSFDYKTEGRKLLEQGNPVISAPKLPKI